MCVQAASCLFPGSGVADAGMTRDTTTCMSNRPNSRYDGRISERVRPLRGKTCWNILRFKIRDSLSKAPNTPEI